MSERYKRGSKKARQSTHNKSTGKYQRQYFRTRQNKIRRIKKQLAKQATIKGKKFWKEQLEKIKAKSLKLKEQSSSEFL